MRACARVRARARAVAQSRARVCVLRGARAITVRPRARAAAHLRPVQREAVLDPAHLQPGLLPPGPVLAAAGLGEPAHHLADAAGAVRHDGGPDRVKEAIDFLRYYAEQANATLTDAPQALGPVVCISPWNFPLAIFTGQIAAALVAGNSVLAKPAEETPLIAAEAVRILHEAGIPEDVLQLLPGDGRIGAGLVAASETSGVLFTGSTEVAKLIQLELAGREAPTPFIAETGGQNAMIVDSSALAEQVTADVLASAFDSAGQRCSALRVLCVQEEAAERQVAMLKGALTELAVGTPARLATDIGPVIAKEAQANITAHIERMRGAGCKVYQVALPDECENGTFVAPTIIEITHISQIGREVFGPVLHVLRYPREGLDALIDQINATGYGLTFGLHTRLDDTIAHVTSRVGAGNLYINRNVIGAVVGVQPFGGRGLSGTGPKAGGPLYLGRLVRSAPNTNLGALISRPAELAGPVGERNLYRLMPRENVLLLPHSPEGLEAQLAAVRGAGCRVTIIAGAALRQAVGNGADDAAWAEDIPAKGAYAAALIEPRPGGIAALLRALAAMDGPIPLVQQADNSGRYRADWLVEEQSISINTPAAGGNASLMALV